MEKLLDAVFELVGLFLADVLDPGPIMGERGVGHGAFQHAVVDLVEFKGKEQQVRGRRGDAFLNIAKEFGADWIGRIAAIDETREGCDPANEIVDRLELADRCRKGLAAVRSARERLELSLVALLECTTLGVRARKVGRHFR